MLIAHISDFHIFADQPEQGFVRHDVADIARRIVADIAGFSPAIDAVMFTGDLTDGGSQKDYALLRDILSPLEMPLLAVPGNHDQRAGFRAIFNDRLPFGLGPTLDYEMRVGDIRVIALDTLKEGHIEGCLTEPQLEWLETRLAQPHSGLTLILMHHPAFPSCIESLDAMALREGRTEFGVLIRDYTGPLRILSGHIHRPFQTLWHDKLCAVGGSPAFAQDLHLAPGQTEPGIVREPYRYFLHLIDGTDAVTIHSRYVEL